jgi:hypothetical protein
MHSRMPRFAPQRSPNQPRARAAGKATAWVRSKAAMRSLASNPMDRPKSTAMRMTVSTPSI